MSPAPEPRFDIYRLSAGGEWALVSKASRSSKTSSKDLHAFPWQSVEPRPKFNSSTEEITLTKVPDFEARTIRWAWAVSPLPALQVEFNKIKALHTNPDLAKAAIVEKWEELKP